MPRTQLTREPNSGPIRTGAPSGQTRSAEDRFQSESGAAPDRVRATRWPWVFRNDSKFKTPSASIRSPASTRTMVRCTRSTRARFAWSASATKPSTRRRQPQLQASVYPAETKTVLAKQSANPRLPFRLRSANGRQRDSHQNQSLLRCASPKSIHGPNSESSATRPRTGKVPNNLNTHKETLTPA